MNSLNVKKLIILGACVSAVYFLIPQVVESLDFKSLALGVTISMCNFYVILWAWSRIFLKKTIALALSVIVFKYAILGLIIYRAVNSDLYNNVSLMLGLSAVLTLVILIALDLSLNKKIGAS